MLIVITGSAGMLAADVMRAAERAGHATVPLDRSRLDIADPGTVEKRIPELLAEHPVEHSAGEVALINCAAYTNVDAAEADEQSANAVNATGAGHLAVACSRAGVRMLHLSTDYVFGAAGPADAGHPRRAFVESDQTAPLGAYGRSKLAGERLVQAASGDHLIVRTAWLFGTDGRNFVQTMLRIAAERGSAQVVDDQVGSPTWTGHLAPALIGLLERQLRGVVHLAGGGEVSWCGFAKEIFRQAEVECELSPIDSAASDRPAARPAYSALASERPDVLPLPPWQDGLAGYLAAQAGMMRA